MNSLAVAIPSTVIPITIAAFAAYAFSWMEFRGRFVLFVAVVALLVVPLQMAVIPILRMFAHGASLFGITHLPGPRAERHVPGCVAGAHGLRAAAGVYLLRNYIGSLPSSIIESARMDGADHFTIFWRLIIPLSVPALAAFAIFQFLWVWNDLLVAYVFLGGTQERAGPHARPGRTERVARRDLAPAHGGGVHLDGAPARSCSSRCRSTSCAV